MKYIITLIFAVTSFSAFAQPNSNFDQEMATSLGADEYGMRSYVLVILKAGPNKITDQAKLDKLFRGHMDNIQKMAKEGKLVMAGPFKKNANDYKGLYVFNVKTIEEAKLLLQDDPLIKENALITEMFDWYGSAALPKYLEFHEKIEKKKP